MINQLKNKLANISNFFCLFKTSSIFWFLLFFSVTLNKFFWLSVDFIRQATKCLWILSEKNLNKKSSQHMSQCYKLFYRLFFIARFINSNLETTMWKHKTPLIKLNKLDITCTWGLIFLRSFWNSPREIFLLFSHEDE